ncbi:hypothetical protein MNBD_GAMMA09-1864 [hydrothermal vent metagenome]|uniref:Uncharacterized protein n=1 Tax=hydrothermal vent metagenome TaxID=652676 RepID=A0A3B0XVL7_9ZZZZ
MNKKILSVLLVTATLGGASTASAFNNGDILAFKAGVVTCLVPTDPTSSCYSGTTVETGSYFAMDLNNDGQFSSTERTAIAVGSDGGIVIGLIQTAGGSHSGCPTGSEISPVDAPWCFFGRTGMHQTVGLPVLDKGDNTLDFSGWGISWDGIANIPLGGDPANFPEDTGLATVSCANTPCTVADSYVIDYTSHVPANDPSAFRTVAYQLHLESELITDAKVFITIDGGNMQECIETGGSNIVANVRAILPAGDTVSSIEWSLDNRVISNTLSIQQFVSLGTHVLSVRLITANGLKVSDAENLNIVDTQPPSVFAAFIDKETATEISQVSNENKVIIRAEAVDVCSVDTGVTAVVGAPVENGQKIKVSQENGKVKLNTSSLQLTVSAADASGNTATEQANLVIIP